MSTPSTLAPSRASGKAVVPSPQPRSSTRSPLVIPRRGNERLATRAHGFGDAGEVALLPQLFVRVHDRTFFHLVDWRSGKGSSRWCWSHHRVRRSVEVTTTTVRKAATWRIRRLPDLSRMRPQSGQIAPDAALRGPYSTPANAEARGQGACSILRFAHRAEAPLRWWRYGWGDLHTGLGGGMLRQRKSRPWSQ